MVDKSRRKLLKYGTAATATAILPGVAGASGPRDDYDIDLHLEDLTVISEGKAETFVGVSVSNNRTTHTHVGRVEEKTGQVSIVDVSADQYETLTSDVGTMTTKDVEREISGTAETEKDVIERADAWGGTNGSCAAYDYTHRWGCVTAEFTRDIDDLGIQTVATALAAYAGATVSSGVIAGLLAGAIFATGWAVSWIVSVDTITLGATEFDKTAVGWNQTMYMTKAGAGWHVDWDDLVTVNVAPTHPGRDHV